MKEYPYCLTNIANTPHPKREVSKVLLYYLNKNQKKQHGVWSMFS